MHNALSTNALHFKVKTFPCVLPKIATLRKACFGTDLGFEKPIFHCWLQLQLQVLVIYFARRFGFGVGLW